jgi:hypothetical protein
MREGKNGLWNFKMKSCTPVEYLRPIEKALGLIQ